MIGRIILIITLMFFVLGVVYFVVPMVTAKIPVTNDLVPVSDNIRVSESIVEGYEDQAHIPRSESINKKYRGITNG